MTEDGTRPSGVRSPARYAVAAACMTAAAAHLPVIEDHLHEALYIGVLFIVLSVVCAAVAAVLIRRDTPASYVVVVVTCAGAVAAYVWSLSHS